jgi:hypothetical protein
MRNNKNRKEQTARSPSSLTTIPTSRCTRRQQNDCAWRAADARRARRANIRWPLISKPIAIGMVMAVCAGIASRAWGRLLSHEGCALRRCDEAHTTPGSPMHPRVCDRCGTRRLLVLTRPVPACPAGARPPRSGKKALGPSRVPNHLPPEAPSGGESGPDVRRTPLWPAEKN